MGLEATLDPGTGVSKPLGSETAAMLDARNAGQMRCESGGAFHIRLRPADLAAAAFLAPSKPRPESNNGKPAGSGVVILKSSRRKPVPDEPVKKRLFSYRFSPLEKPRPNAPANRPVPPRKTKVKLSKWIPEFPL